MNILKIANAIKDSLTLQMQRQSVAILGVANWGELGRIRGEKKEEKEQLKTVILN